MTGSRREESMMLKATEINYYEDKSVNLATQWSVMILTRIVSEEW